MNFSKSLILSFLTFSLCFSVSVNAETLENEPICATYLTGIGCPHCAVVDPYLFEEVLQKFPNFVVIEYELYQEPKNNKVALYLDDLYNMGYGIPNIIFGKDDFISGDSPILNDLEYEIENRESNLCPLSFGELDLAGLGYVDFNAAPKIWRYNRVIYPDENDRSNEDLLNLLIAPKVETALSEIEFEDIEPEEVDYSGGSVEFDYAAKFNGWIIQWNDWEIPDVELIIQSVSDYAKISDQVPETKLTLTKLFSLAIVDAVNPCAIAVLTLMLIAILAYHPDDKRKVLLAGLAFTLSVFVMYLIYGLVIIKLFHFIQVLTDVRLILYKVLGAIAIVLGLLNIKDTLWYKPGGFGTEMPMFMRGRLKKMIAGVTSPLGALFVGVFVTIFLLPCTIGPYVVAGGILSTMDIVRTIPPLLLYNFVFVLPMLFITAIVYFGMTKVQNVSKWKDKNIRYLHLFAGMIMLALGILMVLGLV